MSVTRCPVCEHAWENHPKALELSIAGCQAQTSTLYVTIDSPEGMWTEVDFIRCGCPARIIPFEDAPRIVSSV